MLLAPPASVRRSVEFAARYAGEGLGLSEFLEEVALSTAEDAPSTDGTGGGVGGSLTLMTLHSAKGLEYPTVAICGMEEEIFPTQRALEESRSNPQAIEEERRLCYVGITRARRHLLLSHARWRYLFGQGREMIPSRFLSEVPHSLVEAVEVAAELSWGAPAGAARRARRMERSTSMPAPVRRLPAGAAPRPTPQGVHYVADEDTGPHREGDDFPTDGATNPGGDPLAIGRWVLHPAWGRGQIVGREGTGTGTKLSIRFGRATKRVVAAYAQLQPA